MFLYGMKQLWCRQSDLSGVTDASAINHFVNTKYLMSCFMLPKQSVENTMYFKVAWWL